MEKKQKTGVEKPLAASENHLGAGYLLDPFDKLEGRTWSEKILAIVVAFSVLLAVSFALLIFGDKLNAKGMAVTRFAAKGQAPLAAHFYPAEVRDRIAVALYDPEFLRETGSAWPISYGDHADWLLRIASEADPKPRAIMLDITFGQERDDPSLPRLQETLCTIQNDLGVPVFLAAVASVEDGKLHLRRGLDPIDPKTGASCFTPVDVSYVPDPVDSIAWQYPVKRYLGTRGWVNGEADGEDIASLETAASAIAQQAGQVDLTRESEPLALMWGLQTADLDQRPEILNHCGEGRIDWRRLIPGIVREFLPGKVTGPICPYHKTFSMGQLTSMSEGEMSSAFGGRYVFVGAFIPGYNDFVSSPIHGLIPGVYLHSMALDNLLSFRGEYKIAAEWTEALHSPDLWVSVVLAVLAIVIVRFIWAITRNRLKRSLADHPWFQRIAGWHRQRKTLLARVCWVPFDVATWIVGLSVKAAVALFIVAVLQWKFRIGMLPVTELVAMTLVAEGLHVMKRISIFVTGESGGAAGHGEHD